jgi:hypothetical protein
MIRFKILVPCLLALGVAACNQTTRQTQTVTPADETALVLPEQPDVPLGDAPAANDGVETVSGRYKSSEECLAIAQSKLPPEERNDPRNVGNANTACLEEGI